MVLRLVTRMERAKIISNNEHKSKMFKPRYHTEFN